MSSDVTGDIVLHCDFPDCRASISIDHDPDTGWKSNSVTDIDYCPEHANKIFLCKNCLCEIYQNKNGYWHSGTAIHCHRPEPF